MPYLPHKPLKCSADTNTDWRQANTIFFCLVLQTRGISEAKRCFLPERKRTMRLLLQHTCIWGKAFFQGEENQKVFVTWNKLIIKHISLPVSYSSWHGTTWQENKTSQEMQWSVKRRIRNLQSATSSSSSPVLFLLPNKTCCHHFTSNCSNKVRFYIFWSKLHKKTSLELQRLPPIHIHHSSSLWWA